VLRLPQQHGAGARAVPAHGRQEVAVLPRRGAGPQVLRAARPPRPRPFKKACGSRLRSRPGAVRGRRRQQPRRRRPRRRPPRRRGPARARLLPHQRPPRPQRRACHLRAHAVRQAVCRVRRAPRRRRHRQSVSLPVTLCLGLWGLGPWATLG
jgi:hypothetical protein